MRVTNEAIDPEGPFQQLLAAQADFHARLADETLRYLRRLSSLSGPWTPGTFVAPADGGTLEATASPGSPARLELEVDNRQEVHCLVTPVLTTMIDGAGTTWYPSLDVDPPTSLIAPGECTAWRIAVDVPAELPAGVYHGALLLHGFVDSGVAVTIRVDVDAETAGSTRTAAADDPSAPEPVAAPAPVAADESGEPDDTAPGGRS